MEIYSMAGHLVRRLQQVSSSVFQDRMKSNGFDLTPIQFAAMNAISANPGIDQATLAGLIAYDRTTIGGVVDRLEAKGFLSRVVSAHDRRAREVTLTTNGLAALRLVAPIVRELQPDILAGLTDEEREVFLRLAAKAALAGNELSRAPLIMQEDKDPP